MKQGSLLERNVFFVASSNLLHICSTASSLPYFEPWSFSEKNNTVSDEDPAAKIEVKLTAQVSFRPYFYKHGSF
jgi:hypothetical protein